MALKDIFIKLGKKILDDPNLGSKVTKIVKTGLDITSSNKKVSDKSKEEAEKLYREHVLQSDKEAAMKRKRYYKLHDKVVKFIRNNIANDKYKRSSFNGELLYDVVNEAEKILNEEDFKFYWRHYCIHHSPYKATCPEDYLKPDL
jgi:DNA repair photolyase